MSDIAARLSAASGDAGWRPGQRSSPTQTADTSASTDAKLPSDNGNSDSAIAAAAAALALRSSVSSSDAIESDMNTARSVSAERAAVGGDTMMRMWNDGLPATTSSTSAAAAQSPAANEESSGRSAAGHDHDGGGGNRASGQRNERNVDFVDESAGLRRDDALGTEAVQPGMVNGPSLVWSYQLQRGRQRPAGASAGGGGAVRHSAAAGGAAARGPAAASSAQTPSRRSRSSGRADTAAAPSASSSAPLFTASTSTSSILPLPPPVGPSLPTIPHILIDPIDVRAGDRGWRNIPDAIRDSIATLMDTTRALSQAQSVVVAALQRRAGHSETAHALSTRASTEQLTQLARYINTDVVRRLDAPCTGHVATTKAMHSVLNRVSTLEAVVEAQDRTLQQAMRDIQSLKAQVKGGDENGSGGSNAKAQSSSSFVTAKSLEARLASLITTLPSHKSLELASASTLESARAHAEALCSTKADVITVRSMANDCEVLSNQLASVRSSVESTPSIIAVKQATSAAVDNALAPLKQQIQALEAQIGNMLGRAADGAAGSSTAAHQQWTGGAAGGVGGRGRAGVAGARMGAGARSVSVHPARRPATAAGPFTSASGIFSGSCCDGDSDNVAANSGGKGTIVLAAEAAVRSRMATISTAIERQVSNLKSDIEKRVTSQIDDLKEEMVGQLTQKASKIELTRAATVRPTSDQVVDMIRSHTSLLEVQLKRKVEGSEVTAMVRKGVVAELQLQGQALLPGVFGVGDVAAASAGVTHQQHAGAGLASAGLLSRPGSGGGAAAALPSSSASAAAAVLPGYDANITSNIITASNLPAIVSALNARIDALAATSAAASASSAHGSAGFEAIDSAAVEDLRNGVADAAAAIDGLKAEVAAVQKQQQQQQHAGASAQTALLSTIGHGAGSGAVDAGAVVSGRWMWKSRQLLPYYSHAHPTPPPSQHQQQQRLAAGTANAAYRGGSNGHDFSSSLLNDSTTILVDASFTGNLNVNDNNTSIANTAVPSGGRGGYAPPPPSAASAAPQSSQYRITGLVNWDLQVVNSAPDLLLWKGGASTAASNAGAATAAAAAATASNSSSKGGEIICVRPGLYKVSMGFFALVPPSITILVNGAPAVSLPARAHVGATVPVPLPLLASSGAAAHVVAHPPRMPSSAAGLHDTTVASDLGVDAADVSHAGGAGLATAAAALTTGTAAAGSSMVGAGAAHGQYILHAHPAGAVGGVTAVHYFALPANARLSVLFAGDTRGQGFIEVAKV